MRNFVTAVVVGLLAWAGLAFVSGGMGPAPEDTSHLTMAQRFMAGDDNLNGWITEDESGWACHLMGNRNCGPVA